MDSSTLIEYVIGISRQAGDRILDIYQSDEFGVAYKDDNSPLTKADMASHRSIIAGLAELTPDIPILSEESATLPWAVRKSWQRYWLVDPLDGTKEFIKRNGEFTVNIALIERGEPILGVVNVPDLDILYGGSRAGGAWKIVKDERVPIKTSTVHTGQKELRVVASRSHRSEELEAWLARVEKKFPGAELVSMGSSLKICLVAEGKADIYPRLGPTCEWDTAAAQAVLEAAGGKLVDDKFRIYRYNTKDSLLNPYFYAIGDPVFNFQNL